MKKASRITLIAGMAIALIGFAWSGFSWSSVQNDVRQIGRQGYTEKHKTFDARNIERIKVNIDNVKVVVKLQPSRASTDVTVDYFESDTDSFTLAAADNTLSLTRAQKQHETFMCFFRCASTPAAITVYVPRASVFAYDLQADNAPVHFENTDTIQATTVHVGASNSRVQLQRLTARGDVTINNDNGSIRLRDISSSGRLRLGSSNASNMLSNVRATSITSTTDNGSATLDSIETGELTVSASNASINLDRIAATRSNFTSDNGSVQGSMLGAKDDYSIKMSSDNGSIEVNGARYDGSYFAGTDNAPKSLAVQSSNASIRMTFER